MAYFFIVLAGLIHVQIFVLESLRWGTPKTNRIFGITSDIAKANALFAYNQGFYNLFLALAALGGVLLSFTESKTIAHTLMMYSAGSMIFASLVLAYSKKKFSRPVFIQGLPPLLGVLFFLINFSIKPSIDFKVASLSLTLIGAFSFFLCFARPCTIYLRNKSKTAE